MKNKLKKGDTAYFFDWANEHKKVPVVIQKVKRKTCDVSALDTSKNYIKCCSLVKSGVPSLSFELKSFNILSKSIIIVFLYSN